MLFSLRQYNGKKQADELAGIMRRMADLYESYLIWEDQQGIDDFLD